MNRWLSFNGSRFVAGFFVFTALACGGTQADSPGNVVPAAGGSGGSGTGGGGTSGAGTGGGVTLVDGGSAASGGAAGDTAIEECLGPNPPDWCDDGMYVASGPACGDGELNESGPDGAMEECDDGNPVPGDGCTGTCTVEPNFVCPTPGEPCESTIVCGDGIRTVNESCDDGNQDDGDGCDDNCLVESGWYCPTPGSPCQQITTCGDGRMATGEICDDGNTESGDGCSGGCTVEPGWRCLRPGMPCVAIPVCGDGTAVAAAGEECDDGNLVGDDGCSDACRVEASYWDCPPTGGPCLNTVTCGDGAVERNEGCDDGNQDDGDGCSSICNVETGWVCRVPGRRCIPDCGDGYILPGVEQCEDDDTTPTSGDGCSSTCQLEPGFVCPAVGEACRATVCGDGIAEGTELCDHGTDNGRFDGLGHGCTKACTPEPTCRVQASAGPPPTCATQACSSVCGDGMLLGSEACDDANRNNGDGCDSNCQTEPGFECSTVRFANTQPCTGGGDCLVLPVTYRDFWSERDATRGHPDFLYYGYGSPMTTCVPDATGAMIDDQTARCYGLVQNALDCDGKPDMGNTTCQCKYTDQYGSWWTDTGGNTINTTVIHSSAGFDQWYRNTAGVNEPVLRTMELQSIGGNQYRFEQSGFFPLNGRAGADSVCAYWPYWFQAYPCAGGNNYYFTSEIRYLFLYQGGEILNFRGDDDLWVFVNGRLAVDIGGPHQAVEDQVTLGTDSDSRFGIATGNVYEITVFHADRAPIESNFRLTLSGFTVERTVCQARCGDGVTTIMEECDLGTEQNDGSYGGCNADCTYGPYCGDGRIDGPEECDDGVNTTVAYGAAGCAPGCQRPPRCGDGKLDPQEECDGGATGNIGGYGNCGLGCILGPYCGDGVVNGPEQCDDGLNIGGYGLCGPGCQWGERCGDGIVQAEYGELCDEGSQNGQPGSSCSLNCGLEGYCGDGYVDASAGETCDDGINDGLYGHCTPDCLIGPHCGDGVVSGPEQCDDGVNDGSYGGCRANCTLGPHCGDGVLQAAYEECDDGNLNNNDGCSSGCRTETWIPG